MNVLKGSLSLLLIGAVLAAPAQAASYHVTAFGDTPGFDQIMAQDYTGASKVLNTRSYESGRYARFANLCVSRLKSAELDAALEACDRAIFVAPADLSELVSPVFHKRAAVMTHLYSNRGVVRAVSGDVFGAREDFERALSLDADNLNARRNLEYVSRNDVAQQFN